VRRRKDCQELVVALERASKVRGIRWVAHVRGMRWLRSRAGNNMGALGCVDSDDCARMLALAGMRVLCSYVHEAHGAGGKVVSPTGLVAGARRIAIHAVHRVLSILYAWRDA
jgi:hypothetical protein